MIDVTRIPKYQAIRIADKKWGVAQRLRIERNKIQNAPLRLDRLERERKEIFRQEDPYQAKFRKIINEIDRQFTSSPSWIESRIRQYKEQIERLNNRIKRNTLCEAEVRRDNPQASNSQIRRWVRSSERRNRERQNRVRRWERGIEEKERELSKIERSPLFAQKQEIKSKKLEFSQRLKRIDEEINKARNDRAEKINNLTRQINTNETEARKIKNEAVKLGIKTERLAEKAETERARILQLRREKDIKIALEREIKLEKKRKQVAEKILLTNTEKKIELEQERITAPETRKKMIDRQLKGADREIERAKTEIVKADRKEKIHTERLTTKKEVLETDIKEKILDKKYFWLGGVIILIIIFIFKKK